MRRIVGRPVSGGGQSRAPTQRARRPRLPALIPVPWEALDGPIGEGGRRNCSGGEEEISTNLVPNQGGPAAAQGSKLRRRPMTVTAHISRGSHAAHTGGIWLWVHPARYPPPRCDAPSSLGLPFPTTNCTQLPQS